MNGMVLTCQSLVTCQKVQYRNPSEKFRIDESKSPHLNSKNNMVAQLGAKLEIH